MNPAARDVPAEIGPDSLPATLMGGRPSKDRAARTSLPYLKMQRTYNSAAKSRMMEKESQAQTKRFRGEL
jgi:hypothetical protein